MIQSQIRSRVDTTARWMKAAERALNEGIQVRQLQGSGQWIATSGHDDSIAYELDVTGNAAHGCGCLAGLHGDPVCKHRAAYYLLVGAIDLIQEPEPPARCLSAVANGAVCTGGGVSYIRECAVRGWPRPACPACSGLDLQSVDAMELEHRPAA